MLVKWWLLAIPHYFVVGIFAGGGWFGWQEDDWTWRGPSLIGLLVFFAAVMLLFANRYPRGLFDLVLGLNRWVFRVLAYAALMRDEYPPFRLDMGGDEGGGTAVRPEAPAEPRGGGGGGAGKIALLVVGSILGLTSLGLIAAGVAAVAFDQTQRDADGYLVSDEEAYATDTYALVSDRIHLDLPGPDSTWRSLFGDVRIWIGST